MSFESNDMLIDVDFDIGVVEDKLVVMIEVVGSVDKGVIVVDCAVTNVD